MKETATGTADTPRRDFLRKTGAVLGGAALALPAIAPATILGGPLHTSPNEKLGVAGIGFGGMGRNNLRACETENIVALADVDHAYAAGVFKRYPKAAAYKDYRRMLDAEKSIDAVVIATPDHTHAVISMAAMLRGKHVYCQKPLTHDVREARMLAKTAEEKGLSTQMGIQGHSGDGARRICEWIRAGAIGAVRDVDAWCSLSYYPHGHTWWSAPLARRPKESQTVPSTLDWDVWLGPAEYRPYHRCYHPKCWRTWWDFGSGMMGDRGVHTLDPVFWALDLGMPTTVEGTSTGLNPDTHPVASVVTFQFEARGDMPPVKVTWWDGLRPPRPEELPPGAPMGHPQGGVVFKGDKGKILCGVYGDHPVLIPEARHEEFKSLPKTIDRIPGGLGGHEQEWVQCCKTGKKPGAHFGYSGALNEVAVLGNVARRVDAKIEWDAATMKVTNVPDANQYIAKTYRAGWSLEG